MTSESDREYLEKLLVRIKQHGVVVEHHSNLVAATSRLHHLRTQETDPRQQERLDFELDAVMRVIDGREPRVPRSIDEHLDHAEDLHRRMLDIFEAAVDRLANARPGGAS